LLSYYFDTIDDVHEIVLQLLRPVAVGPQHMILAMRAVAVVAFNSGYDLFILSVELAVVSVVADGRIEVDGLRSALSAHLEPFFSLLWDEFTVIIDSQTMSIAMIANVYLGRLVAANLTRGYEEPVLWRPKQPLKL
jgi:hypothetical protein